MVACKAGAFQPSLAPVQSQVNDEGEGDSRMFNFVRENPREQGVDCVRRIDSEGHLCGALSAVQMLAHCLGNLQSLLSWYGRTEFLWHLYMIMGSCASQRPCPLCRTHIQVNEWPGPGQHAGSIKACVLIRAYIPICSSDQAVKSLLSRVRC